MATPPTFVQEAETALNTSTTPKVTASMTNLVGDVLVCLGAAGDGNTTAVTPTLSGESFGSALDNVGTTGSSGRVETWAATVASAGTGETVSVARAGSANFFGANVLTFRNSNGIGAHNASQITAGTTASTLGITTTADNSALGVVVVDWTAGTGARTWLTVNGTTPTVGNGLELSYFADGVNYGVYIAYYPDAGAAGLKTVGLSAPTMRWSIAAVEILGTSSPFVPTPALPGMFTPQLVDQGWF